MQDSLWERVQSLSDDQQRSVSDCIRLILMEYFEALDGKLQIEIED
jgi:hypothetical protein